METDPQILEKEAHALLEQEKFSDAFKLFFKSAHIYKSRQNHKQASLLFASAASCWSIKSGEKAFYNSAACYEEAALQAESAQDYEYASLLYKYAAINYERDMESLSFSDCFYRSKESFRKFLTYHFFNPKKIHHIKNAKEKKGALAFIKYFFAWLGLTLSYLAWGHGERPVRAFFCAVSLIFLCAVGYSFGMVMKDGAVCRPGFFDALYFSVITFTTVGFGDITAVGAAKVIAAIEPLAGMFLMPLFIVGLSRKFLRV